jgi:hypothetical protein
MTDDADKIVLRPRIPLSEEEALARLSAKRARRVHGNGKKFVTSLGRNAKALLKDQGPGIGMLKSRWADLAGEKLARVSSPLKLTGKKGAWVLTLEILPAAAPLFQHQGEGLRQKLSIMMGGELKSIKLVQTNPKTAGRKPGYKAPMPLKDVRALEAELSDIKNKQLSEALLAFGKAVYTDKN